MSTLRQAAQQALETLYLIRDGATGLYGDDLRHCNKAISQLTKELEKKPDSMKDVYAGLRTLAMKERR